jgi:hypothetical protein
MGNEETPGQEISWSDAKELAEIHVSKTGDHGEELTMEDKFAAADIIKTHAVSFNVKVN